MGLLLGDCIGERIAECIGELFLAECIGDRIAASIAECIGELFLAECIADSIAVSIADCIGEPNVDCGEPNVDCIAQRRLHRRGCWRQCCAAQFLWPALR